MTPIVKQDEPIQSSKIYPPRVLLSTKGLSIVITGSVLIVGLVKADSADIPKIFEIVFRSNTFTTIGYVLAVMFLLGGVIFIRLQQGIYEREISRLSKERDDLQKKLLDKK